MIPLLLKDFQNISIKIMYMIRQRERCPGTENSMVEMEEFKLVSQSGTISGECFKIKESTLEKVVRMWEKKQI